MNYTLGLSAWLLKLTLVFTDLTFIGLICYQDNSLMNYTLGSIIYLGPNAIMIARLSSYKSRFICHFRIAALLREIVL